MDLIQRITGAHGQTSVLGKSLTWQKQISRNDYSFQVRISGENEDTLVSIEGRYLTLAGGIFGGILGGLGGGLGLGAGMGIGLGALHSVLFAILWPIGILSGAFLLARTLFRFIIKRQAKLSRQVLDRLTEQLKKLAAPAGKLKNKT